MINERVEITYFIAKRVNDELLKEETGVLINNERVINFQSSNAIINPELGYATEFDSKGVLLNLPYDTNKKELSFLIEINILSEEKKSIQYNWVSLNVDGNNVKYSNANIEEYMPKNGDLKFLYMSKLIYAIDTEPNVSLWIFAINTTNGVKHLTFNLNKSIAQIVQLAVDGNSAIEL